MAKAWFGAIIGGPSQPAPLPFAGISTGIHYALGRPLHQFPAVAFPSGFGALFGEKVYPPAAGISGTAEPSSRYPGRVGPCIAAISPVTGFRKLKACFSGKSQSEGGNRKHARLME